MARWHPLEPVDLGTFATAAQVYRYPIKLPVPPARVWESLQSDESLAAWGLGVRRLTWTSPRPFGVGTTREVVLPLGLMTLREHFFRWDEGSGYSFYVVEADRPGLTSFAENYVVEPDGDGTLLTWTIAIQPKPGTRAAMKLLAPLNRRAFGRFAVGARKYFAANPVSR